MKAVTSKDKIVSSAALIVIGIAAFLIGAYIVSLIVG